MIKRISECNAMGMYSGEQSTTVHIGAHIYFVFMQPAAVSFVSMQHFNCVICKTS